MSERTTWRNRKEADNIIDFKESDILELKFLNDGVDIYDVKITQKDGSEKIIKHQVKFKVIDTFDKNEYVFNATAVRLMTALANATDNLKGKTIKIERIRGRKPTDNTYKATLIKTTKA